MKAVKLNTLIFCLSMITLVNLEADEDLTQSNPGLGTEHVALDSRPLSEEQKQLMEEKRIAEAQNLLPQEEELISYSEGVIDPLAAGFILVPGKSDLAAGFILVPQKETASATKLLASSEHMVQATAASSFSPHLYHWITIFHEGSNVIELEDGSEWSFDKSSYYTVRSWRVGDTIVITPKSNWLWGSDFTYVLNNKSLNSSVDVAPFQGPVVGGNHSIRVVGMDYAKGHIYLFSGQGGRSTWVVSNHDAYLLKDWKVDDTSIVGENDSWLWWFSPYNHILINVNMNHFIRVRPL